MVAFMRRGRFFEFGKRLTGTSYVSGFEQSSLSHADQVDIHSTSEIP